MTVPDLIELLEARMVDLAQQRATLASLGDIPGVLRLETELQETEITLAALRSAIGV